MLEKGLPAPFVKSRPGREADRGTSESTAGRAQSRGDREEWEMIQRGVMYVSESERHPSLKYFDFLGYGNGLRSVDAVLA